MQTIYQLSDQIIAKIAAGEVIERPAYAVKELIDNSIDAQSSRISIELHGSGLEKIVVTDNGVGMAKEDLMESYKLHTTSKITNNDSLLAIKTLGFRGEALASIANVSHMTIESKKAEEVTGTKIRLVNGILDKTSLLGMPNGTRVIVEELFHSVPGRKNYLKSKRTELRRIIDAVLAQALALPKIGFRLIHENKLLFEFPESQTLRDRINVAFEKNISDNLLPVQLTNSYINVSGFILHPQQSSQTIPKQFLSINGRSISDKFVQIAVKESYGVLLSKEIQPSWFLSLNLPYETLDVNIHPRKEEVRFIDQPLLFDTVMTAIKNSLHAQTIVYEHFQKSSMVQEKITSTYLGDNLKKTILPWNKTLLTNLSEDILVQLHNLYILHTTTEGFILIDQHAAHERILYEQFLHQFIKKKNEGTSIPLLKPVLLDLLPSEQILIEEYLPDLTTLGFRIHNFLGNTYNITNVPLIFKDRNIKKIISQLLSEFSREMFTSGVDSQSKKLLAYLACRSAVKSGDPLTLQQMKDIIKELDKNPEAITCPHGRPLKISISLVELNKMFKRK